MYIWFRFRSQITTFTRLPDSQYYTEVLQYKHTKSCGNPSNCEWGKREREILLLSNMLWKLFKKTRRKVGDPDCHTRVSSSLIGSQMLSALRRGLTGPKFLASIKTRFVVKSFAFNFFLLLCILGGFNKYLSWTEV